MSKWEQLAAALLDPSREGWQRLGYLGPDGKRLVDNLRRKTSLGQRWHLALRGGIVYAKRKEPDEAT